MGAILNVNIQPFFKYSKTVNRLCKPLFHYTPVTFFYYLRRFYDGRRTILTSRPDIISMSYEEDYFYGAWIDSRSFETYNSELLFWDVQKIFQNEKERQVGYFIQNEFKLRHGLSFVIKKEDYIDFYEFGSLDQAIYQMDVPLLKKFIYYFKEQAKNLIDDSLNDVISIPEEMMMELQQPNNQYDINKYLEEINTKRYYINSLLENVYLTQQELKCILLRYEGLQAKKIARELNISHKTVNRHFENIHAKLQGVEHHTLIKEIINLDL